MFEEYNKEKWRDVWMDGKRWGGNRNIDKQRKWKWNISEWGILEINNWKMIDEDEIKRNKGKAKDNKEEMFAFDWFCLIMIIKKMRYEKKAWMRQKEMNIKEQ